MLFLCTWAEPRRCVIQAYASLETIARESLEQSWQKQRLPGQPPVELTPIFTDLLAESYQQPAHHLAPMIHRILLERTDACQRGNAQAEQLVRTIVNVLEDVRRVGIEQGQWSEVPVTPLMFG